MNRPRLLGALPRTPPAFLKKAGGKHLWSKCFSCHVKSKLFRAIWQGHSLKLSHKLGRGEGPASSWLHPDDGVEATFLDTRAALDALGLVDLMDLLDLA
jgi:hypothetical protein